MGKVIHYSQSFRDFLETRKESSVIARVLFHAYQKDDDLASVEDRIRAYDLMLTTEQINYLTFRNNGNISFLPAGKEHIATDGGTWLKENRQEGKPGKVIRKLFTDKALKIIPAKEFEQFTNQYKAEFNEDGYTFAVLPNTRINEVYNNTNRKEGGASLNSSCMNRNSPHRESDVDGIFLEMYAMCDNLQIVTLTTRNGQLCGRALLWTLDSGIKLMDRIYVSDDFMYDMFINYALDNCMWRKESYKSVDNPLSFINHHGENEQRTFIVKTCTDFKRYPYVDTFRYGGDGWLSNSDYEGHEYIYCNTGGTRDCADADDDYDGNDGDNHYYDEINDRDIDADDAVFVDRGRYRSQWTHRDNTVEVSGNIWWQDDEDIVHLSWDNEWYERDEVVYSERDQEDYPIAECRQIGNSNGWVLKEDTVRDHNGDWQHKDDCELLDNGEYAIEDDWVETHDGRKILEIYSVELDDKIYHEDDAEVQPDYSVPTAELCNKLACFEKPNINQLTFVELCEKD